MTNELGIYSSLTEVWARYPQGGKEGDTLIISDEQYKWDKYTNNWIKDGPCEITPARDEINLYNDYVFNHDVKVLGKFFANAIRQPNCGLFGTLEELKEAFPNPIPGYWACIGNSVPAPIYRYSVSKEWIATGEVGGVQSDNDKLEALERNVQLLSEHEKEQDASLLNKVEGFVLAAIEGVSNLEKAPILGTTINANFRIVYSNYNKRVLAISNGNFYTGWNEKILGDNTVIHGSVWFSTLNLQNKIVFYHEIGDGFGMPSVKNTGLSFLQIIQRMYPHLYYVNENGQLEEFITSILVNNLLETNNELNNEIYTLNERITNLENKLGAQPDIQEELKILKDQILSINNLLTI